jgi:hypothetical protein
MPTGYSRSPKLLKGALVEFSQRFISSVPNVIVFQYNPENLSRTLSVWSPPEQGEVGSENKVSGTAQPEDPDESFTLNLELDATDALERPDKNPQSVISGVADRIAALEMLLYPIYEGGSLLGSETQALGGGGEKGDTLTRGSVPIVLFVWGPGRVVPVRLTSFSVEEQAFSTTLYPVRAKVAVALNILKPGDLAKHWDKKSAEIAIAAFNVTRKQKQALAASNIANNVDALLGMLPF